MPETPVVPQRLAKPADDDHFALAGLLEASDADTAICELGVLCAGPADAMLDGSVNPCLSAQVVKFSESCR